MSVQVSQGLNATAAKAFASEIERNPEVESVEPVLHMTINENTGVHPAAVSSAPNDQYWNRQWGLNSENGIDAPGAWATNTGSGVTVAVIDSGITKHPDLDGKVLPGYDFISDRYAAGDGNGRDSDPSDEAIGLVRGPAPGVTCRRRGMGPTWRALLALRPTMLGVSQEPPLAPRSCRFER
ncbi:extracellular protease precursor [Cutibacterium acnes JCM 18918]|nr:extracellular protease precursor [Cutibacterium acnes JCM 18918]